MKGIRCVGELAEFLYDDFIPVHPALREVEPRQKADENFLNAIGHICNRVATGYAKLKSVEIECKRMFNSGWAYFMSSLKIDRTDCNGLEVKVKYCHLSDNNLNNMVAKRQGKYLRKGFGYILHEKAGNHHVICDNPGLDGQVYPYHEQRIRVENNYENGSLLIKAETPMAGYLIRDILGELGIVVTPRDNVKVIDERNAWDKISDYLLSKVLPKLPLGWLERGISVFDGAD